MKIGLLGFILLFAVVPAEAREDVDIARLVTCTDSWLDWQEQKNIPQLRKFGEKFSTEFSEDMGDGSLTPKGSLTFEGLRVLEVIPRTFAMGAGFSILVDTPFDKTRRIVEKALGKPFSECHTNGDMRICARDISDTRGLMLMANTDPEYTMTIVGCFYPDAPASLRPTLKQIR